MSDEPQVDEVPPAKTKKPLYPRLLRLRHVRPNAWQRAVLGEGAIGVAVLLVLADLATAWTLLVLPLAVALVVKVHDVLAGLMWPASGGADEGGQSEVGDVRQDGVGQVHGVGHGDGVVHPAGDDDLAAPAS